MSSCACFGVADMWVLFAQQGILGVCVGTLVQICTGQVHEAGIAAVCDEGSVGLQA